MDTVFANPGAAFDSRRHESRPTRSRKGRSSFVVTRRGRAQIVGTWFGSPVDGRDDVDSYPVLAEVLTELGVLRHGTVGCQAHDVLTVTQRLYGDDIGPLMGTDYRAWATVTPARTGVRHDTDDDGAPVYGDWASADECAVARHRTDLLADLPHGAMLAGVKASDLEDERDHPGALKAWPTRYRLRRVHGRRIGDPTDRHEVLASGYCITGRDHLTSPSDDRERVWVGHTLTARPTPRNGVTAGHKRSRVARRARTVEHFHAADLSTLCWLFAKLNPGERVTWQCGAMSGAFTRASNGRYSMSGDAESKSVRTLDAIRIKLERAAA